MSWQQRRRSHCSKDIRLLTRKKPMRLRLHRAITQLLCKNLDILWLKVQSKASKSCRNFKPMSFKRRLQIQSWGRSALKMNYLRLDTVKTQKLPIRNLLSWDLRWLNSWNTMPLRAMAKNCTQSSFLIALYPRTLICYTRSGQWMLDTIHGLVNQIDSSLCTLLLISWHQDRRTSFRKISTLIRTIWWMCAKRKSLLGDSIQEWCCWMMYTQDAVMEFLSQIESYM